METSKLSIQELENLNVELYQDKPDELTKFAKDLLKAKRFEKAIEVFEEALKQNIKRYKDEFSIECAKSYYYYADALIYKLQESGEMFQISNNKPEESKLQEDHSKQANGIEEKQDDIQVSNIHSGQQKQIIEEEQKNAHNNMEDEGDEYQEEDEEEDSDEQVAFYNLVAAEKILKEFLKKYEGVPRQELPPKIIDYYLDLADVYLKYGELEQIKSDFKQAINFFNQSLEMMKRYNDKHSRAAAELHYMIGNAADYDAKLAMVSFYKTYLIMKKHLMKEFGKEIEINTDFDSLRIEDIDLSQDLLLIDENDKEEVVELKQIMTELKQKIEDVSEEVRLMDQYLAEKQKQTIKTEFTNNYDTKNLIDLNKTGIVKKRVKEDSNPVNLDTGKVAKIIENGVTKIITTSSNQSQEQNEKPSEKKEESKEN